MIKISSIPQIYRNVNRWGEILRVLSRYGLADWVSRLGLDFANQLFKDQEGELIARHRQETRVRLALTDLGPTFIKLGQILSTRPDLVGTELARELQHLQANVRADAPAAVRALVERELGRPTEQLFAAFEETPLASGSIGQVHRARLATGEPVVVKVQHEAIEEKVRVDLEILNGLAALAERIPEYAIYRPEAIVAEFRRTLKRELDFTRELRNLQLFAADFADDPRVHFPRVYPQLSTARVLTMERLEGIPLADTPRLSELEADRGMLARRGAEIYLEMIFTNGFYHADPHPGNIVVLPDQVIGLIDCGMVGRIDEPLREDIEEMLLAVSERDPVQLTSLITRIGTAPLDLDVNSLSVDVAEYVANYAHQSLEELDLGAALTDLIEIIRRYRVVLPPRVALLIKTIIVLEGTSRLLAPRFSLVEVIEPYRRKMLWRRLSPARQARKLRRLYTEVERLLRVLPGGLVDIIQQVQSGKFDIHLDHRGLEPSVNRLVLGMLTSALFLGSSLLLSRGVHPVLHYPPLIENLSVLGLLGSLVSLALGLRLLWAINKSGHLEKHDK